MYALPTPIMLSGGSAAHGEYHPARGVLVVGEIKYTLSMTEQATLADALDYNAEGVRCKLRDGALWVHVDRPESHGHLLAVLQPAPIRSAPVVDPAPEPVDPPAPSPEEMDPPAPPTPEIDARPEN